MINQTNKFLNLFKIYSLMGLSGMSLFLIGSFIYVFPTEALMVIAACATLVVTFLLYDNFASIFKNQLKSYLRKDKKYSWVTYTKKPEKHKLETEAILEFLTMIRENNIKKDWETFDVEFSDLISKKASADLQFINKTIEFRMSEYELIGRSLEISKRTWLNFQRNRIMKNYVDFLKDLEKSISRYQREEIGPQRHG